MSTRDTTQRMGPVGAVNMIAEEFADAVEKLITARKTSGLMDGVIIAWLEEAAGTA